MAGTWSSCALVLKHVRARDLVPEEMGIHSRIVVSLYVTMLHSCHVMARCAAGCLTMLVRVQTCWTCDIFERIVNAMITSMVTQ